MRVIYIMISKICKITFFSTVHNFNKISFKFEKSQTRHTSKGTLHFKCFYDQQLSLEYQILFTAQIKAIYKKLFISLKCIFKAKVYIYLYDN